MVHRVPGFGVPSRACNSGNSNAAADESASSGCFFFFPLEGVASPQTAALTGTASTGSAWPTSEAAALLKTARGGRGATSPARQHGGACSPARVAWCAKLFRRLRLSSPQPCAESAAYYFSGDGSPSSQPRQCPQVLEILVHADVVWCVLNCAALRAFGRGHEGGQRARTPSTPTWPGRLRLVASHGLPSPRASHDVGHAVSFFPVIPRLHFSSGFPFLSSRQ